MLTFRILTVGTLKEGYWRDAIAEYKKRLSAFCRVEEINLKESRVPENPSQGEITVALNAEGQMMQPYLTPRVYKIALCVEGKQFTSEELAACMENISTRTGEIVLVIGSSHGISPEIKRMCDLKLSFSALTFPHQMARVMLYEVLYRSMNILKGTKYHK